MCRILYIPDVNDTLEIDLLDLLERLEKQGGGKGNGVGGFVDGKPFIVKGTKLSVKECLDYIDCIKWDNDSVLFHSRLPSKGSICDGNCHPFVFNEIITVHNGTWLNSETVKWQVLFKAKSEGKDTDLLIDELTDCTDSEIIAFLIANFGFKVTNLIEAGVIVSMFPPEEDSKVMMTKERGSFEALQLPNEKWIYASSFTGFDGGKDAKRLEFSTWATAILTRDGAELIEGKLEKPTTYYYTYKRRQYPTYTYPAEEEKTDKTPFGYEKDPTPQQQCWLCYNWFTPRDELDPTQAESNYCSTCWEMITEPENIEPCLFCNEGFVPQKKDEVLCGTCLAIMVAKVKDGSEEILFQIHSGAEPTDEFMTAFDKAIKQAKKRIKKIKKKKKKLRKKQKKQEEHKQKAMRLSYWCEEDDDEDFDPFDKRRW